MLPEQTLRILVAGSLLLHGIAHAIALGALVIQSLAGPSASRFSVGSWLVPSMSLRQVALAMLPFWLVSTFAFLAASGSFWGLIPNFDSWNDLAIAGAVASLLGITFSSGLWPGSPDRFRSVLNTAIALTMNAIILITQLWLHWPSRALSG